MNERDLPIRSAGSLIKKKRVFLSFRAEDSQQVQALGLLAANPEYDREFYDNEVNPNCFCV